MIKSIYKNPKTPTNLEVAMESFLIEIENKIKTLVLLLFNPTLDILTNAVKQGK